MTLPDFINGSLEMIGGFTIWYNVYAIVKDKGYAGIRWPQVMFFAGWGYWNLYYYPHLMQWFSLVGGINVVLANTVWVGMMIYYGRV